MSSTDRINALLNTLLTLPFSNRVSVATTYLSWGPSQTTDLQGLKLLEAIMCTCDAAESEVGCLHLAESGSEIYYKEKWN